MQLEAEEKARKEVEIKNRKSLKEERTRLFVQEQIRKEVEKKSQQEAEETKTNDTQMEWIQFQEIIYFILSIFNEQFRIYLHPSIKFFFNLKKNFELIMVNYY